MQRTLALALGMIWFAACGGAGGLVVEPTSQPASLPTSYASFGVAERPALLVADPVAVRVFNYSAALILDMGLRPIGTSGAYAGGLRGHDPASFGRGGNGGVHWLTVPPGGYEIFIETDQGRLDISGWTPEIEGPNGVTINGPADIYIFGFDFGGRLPVPPPRPVLP